MFVETLAFAMKVVLHENYDNPVNLFNQVGIVQLNMYGQVATVQVPHIIDENALRGGGLKAPASKQSVFYGVSVYDSRIRERMEHLREARMRAHAKEDYVQARALKEMLDQLEEVGYELVALEKKKKQAVQKEDYLLAKQFKQDIDAIMGRILSHSQSHSSDRFKEGSTPIRNMRTPPPLAKINMSSRSGLFARSGSSFRENVEVKTIIKPGENEEDHPLMPLTDDLILQDFQEYGVPTNGFNNQLLINRKEASKFVFPEASKQEHKILDISAPSISMEPLAFQEERKLPSMLGFDEQPIPAIAKVVAAPDQTISTFKHDRSGIAETSGIGGFGKTAASLSGAAGGGVGADVKRREDLPDAEGLSEENRKKAGKMVGTFGEETMKRFFSRNWGLREDALKVIANEFEKEESKLRVQNPEKDLLSGAYGLIAYSLSDKIAQVATQGFKMLQHIDSYFTKERPGLKAMGAYQEAILTALNDRIGDSNPKLRELAQDALLSLCDEDADLIVRAVLQLASKKTQNSFKHLIGRAKLLGTILARSRADSTDIGNFAVGISTNPNKDVRNAAIDLLVAHYNQRGPSKTAPFSGKLKSAQKEVLNEALKKNSKK